MQDGFKIGYVYELKNLQYKKRWIGGLEDVCSQIESDGFLPSAVWQDKASQLKRSSIVSTLDTVVGSKNLAELLAILSIALGSKPISYRDIFEASRTSNLQFLESISRLACATGEVEILPHIRGSFGDSVLLNLNASGMNAIAYAVAYGNDRVIAQFSHEQIRSFRQNKLGWNLADLAMANGHGTMVRTLLHIGAQSHSEVLPSLAQKYRIPIELLGPLSYSITLRDCALP